MSKTYLSLTKTERAVLEAASRIYAARLAARIVPEGQETPWLQQSAEEAVQLAKLIDESLVSDTETG